MNFSKYIDLLLEQKLHFSRADVLGDPLEGSVPLANKKLYDFIVQQKRSGQDWGDPYPDVPPESIERMQEAIASARKMMRQNFFISCWHMNENESAAMWKLYADSHESVCIQTDFRRASELLPNWVFGTEVKYISYVTDFIAENNVFSPYIHKRKSFEHEREFRFLVWSMMADEKTNTDLTENLTEFAVRIPINLREFLENIYVHPEAPEWFRQIVEKITIKEGLDIPVRQSSLLVDPIY